MAFAASVVVPIFTDFLHKASVDEPGARGGLGSRFCSRPRAAWLGACLLLGCVREEPDARALAKAPLTATTTPPLGRPAAVAASAPVTASSNATSAVSATPAKPPLLAFDPPVELHFPTPLAAGERVPFVLILHGYGVPSALLSAKAPVASIANQKRFAYAIPDGNRDAAGRPFWNAGPSCCDTDKTGVDDVARLTALIELARGDARVDSQRVFIIGYSNGGFMAHRLACDIGDRLAGVISVSGAAPAKDARCVRSPRLSVLQIHGQADPFVRYEGGTVLGRSDFAPHPSALETVQSWAERLGCAGPPVVATERDLEPALPGAETSVQRFQNCSGAVELWTARGGAHYVALRRPAFDAMWQFLSREPPPPAAAQR